MKDIKATLKEARVAIKNKDYEVAMKLSKSILKEDKSNYMALVFLGLSLQELGPVDQAPKAFQKAIESNSSNPLAWQGLINYYERLNADEVKPELVNIYMKYLRLEGIDATKQIEYCKKLVENCKYGCAIEVCKTLFECIKKNCEDKTEILKLLSTLLESQSDPSDELIELYESCILYLIKTADITENLYSSYLTMLNKTGQPLKVLEQALQMNIMFPSSSISLSWICKMFNQMYIEGDKCIKRYEENIGKYSTKLLEMDSKNTMGYFTEAVLLCKNKKFLEAKEKLIEVTSQRPGLIHAWFLLTDTLKVLKLYEEALETLAKTKKLLASLSKPKNISDMVICQELELLSMSDDPNHWTEALEICSKSNFITKCLPTVIQLNINLGQITVAERYISQLQEINESNAVLYQVRLLNKQKRFSESLKLLKKYDFNFSEWWIEYGLTYCMMEQHQNSLEPFLKAAKCDTENYLVFNYLGLYYSRSNQLDKARRCFEKAFKINQRSTESGSELSKIYRKQKNWEANYKLLTRLTQGTINKKNVWAYIQLGLTFLEQGDCSQSIEYLRIALRFETENVHCWESLADAYFSRGAFTSALKCYQKASELSQGSLYPSLQVANIQRLLGEYTEAISNFEKILIDNGQYVPALKGLAETCFSVAKECFKEQRLGTARDYAQIAANKIMLAALQRSESSCLWKILGDCSLFIAKLPEKYSFLSIQTKFLETQISDGQDLLEKEEIFRFSIKCYSKAVSLARDNSFLWHDLATCYLTFSSQTSDPETKARILNFALASSQHCTTLNPDNWQHWNLLGVISVVSEPPSYSLAQHSFIKALIADHKSAVSWTNLGVIYFLMNDLKLANKAFSEAQKVEPNYINCWVGQAIIAESMQHEEAMDLFRHSVQLGHHQQSSIGYSHWVCQTLLNMPFNDKRIEYAIYNMHAIPVACDSINWYTEHNPNEGCAWNILGLLQERMGLVNSAKKACKLALVLAEKEYKDKARTNYGRLLYKTDNYEGAIEMFRDVTECSFKSGSGLALALFKNGHYEASYEAYEQALHWLTDEQIHQSDLLVALASMAYLFQGVDTAKTLLFQSIDLKPPSPWSLYSTLSLSLLHKDLKLSELVLKRLSILEMELRKYGMDKSDFVSHYTCLLSYFYLLEGDEKKAIPSISKLVHKYPNEAPTWLILSQLLFRLKKSKKYIVAAIKCIDIAVQLGQANTNISKVLSLASLSFHAAGEYKKSIIFAQKAVHYYPECSDGWLMLVLSSKKYSKNFVNKFKDYFSKINCNDCVMQWLEKNWSLTF